MKLGFLRLKNFRGIRQLDLALDAQLTVLFGVNGAGKTSVLDAIAILLSWVVARVRHSGSSGRSIVEIDIKNEEKSALIRAETIKPTSLSWQLAKTRSGYGKQEFVSELKDISDYAKSIQGEIAETGEHCNIPLFVYYPVNRAVIDIPLRIRKSHKFSLLEAWDESLTSGANFRSNFEWFRNREDLENENRRYLDQLIQPDNWQFPDPQLEAVRRALEAFLPHFKAFSVRRNPLRMTVEKRGKETQVQQLSDGEKCLIAMVADLARRLAIANPNLSNPLEGEGIVLIDEIELHLHPAWQRMMPTQLTKTFPRCQFVVSTHSPQVLGEVAAERVRLLMQDEDNEISYVIPEQSMGLTSNEILDELMRPTEMRTLARNSDVEQQLTNLFKLIDDEKFDKARHEIERIKRQLHGDIPDLVRAQSLLTMLDVTDSE